MRQLYQAYLTFINTNRNKFSSFLFMLIGVGIGLMLYKFATHSTTPSAEQREVRKKDTIYVNVISGVVGDTSGNSSIKKPSSVTDQENSFQIPTSKDSATIFNSGVNLIRNSPVEKIISNKPLVSFFEFSNNRTLISNRTIVIMIFIIIGIVAFLKFKSLPILSSNIDIDTDPKELISAFQTHSGKILALGNPRKIKRLSNRIRFQYHYLKKAGFLQNESDIELLIKILLLLENKEEIKDGSHNNGIVDQLVELNKDMF